MKIVLFFLLLNIIYCVNIDEYYRKQFTNETRDPHLILTNKTKESKIPLILMTENIPRNATLLKIDKNQLLISCSNFPYDELIFQYINQYFSQKKITSSFYSELVNLIVKILFYKYAPLETIKKEFIPMDITTKEEYEYELDSNLREYIDVIYAQLNSSKYNFDYSKLVNKDFLERYKLGDNFIADEVYDYIIDAIKLNKNEKLVNLLKSFLFDKREEFIKLFFYINSNGFSLSYPHYEEFYLGKNDTNYIKSNYICVYISPITDMLDTKVNLRNKGFTFSSYPILNNSLLVYTRSAIQKKETNGILTKFFSVSNDNLFYQYNYEFDEYKKYNLKKYLYSKELEVIVPKKYIEGPENKKVTTCQLLNICRGLMPVPNDNTLLKMSNFIGTTNENPHLMSFGRLLFLDEKELLNEENKEKFQIFIKSFSTGTKISDENELLAYLFYYDQLNREIVNYKDFFSDIKNKEKDIEENKNIFRLIELNLKVVLMNYNFILDKMENLLTHEIIDNI